jgi:hypothetical protein
LDFQQQKTGLYNYTAITDEIISKISCIKAFETKEMAEQNTELNNMLYNYHKELLLHAKNKNKNMEVGYFWDLNNLEKKPLVINGTMQGFSIQEDTEIRELVMDEKNILNVVLMHNHPRNGLFSGKDLRSFSDFKSIYFMTAICNDGTIHMLRKELGFDKILLEFYYNEGVKQSKIAVKNEQIAKAKKLGFDVNNPKYNEKINNIPTKAYNFGVKNVIKHSKEIGITYRCSVKRK